MSTAVAERIDAAPAPVDQPPSSDAANMLAMIERMAINPNIDADKLERLIAMKRGMDSDAARKAYNTAFILMQPDLPAIGKRGKTDKATYALWEDIQDRVIPVLKAHGFALSFKTSNAANLIIVTAILRHEAGHEETSDFSSPPDTGPGRNAIQAMGSTVSYGKRYTAGALLNLRLVGEDDDGARAGGVEVITAEQAADLLKRIAAVGATPDAFCKVARIAAVADLMARDYDRAMSWLDQRARAKPAPVSPKAQFDKMEQDQ